MQQQLNTVLLSGCNEDDCLRAIELLKANRLVALPTETVYGLAANALNAEAITNVFAAKSRPLFNPLILHVAEVKAALHCLDLSSHAKARTRFEALAQAFWPGPLTMIAKKAAHIPHEACGGLDTVAVRIPDHPLTRMILAQLDFPLVMPSANVSTRPSPTKAEHVLRTLNGLIDAVLDGGPASIGIESTVLRIDSDKPAILRPGHISADAMAQILGEEIKIMHQLKKEAQPESPGQSLLHYSPLISSVNICHIDEAHKYWRENVTILSCQSDFNRIRQGLGPRPNISSNKLLSDQAHEYARELYNALYACEQNAQQKLVIILPSNTQDFSAVIDRLQRMPRDSNDQRH